MKQTSPPFQARIGILIVRRDGSLRLFLGRHHDGCLPGIAGENFPPHVDDIYPLPGEFMGPKRQRLGSMAAVDAQIPFRHASEAGFFFS